jgi:Outer membrane protein beta-barrel domain
MMTRIIFMAAVAVTAAFAQQWEFGGLGGAGFINSVGVTAPTGSATAGFQNGAAFGAYAGYNSYRHIGGELRYNFMQSNLKLSSGGQTATFSGNSHTIGYDVVFHTNKGESKTQLFAVVGAGVKIFRGTGKEAAYQPLSSYGYFTKTHAFKPMGNFGAGVKVRLSDRVFLRTEVRDYITPFPKEIIAPPPGVKYGTLLHDIVPMVGIGIDM